MDLTNLFNFIVNIDDRYIKNIIDTHTNIKNNLYYELHESTNIEEFNEKLNKNNLLIGFYTEQPSEININMNDINFKHITSTNNFVYALNGSIIPLMNITYTKINITHNKPIYYIYMNIHESMMLYFCMNEIVYNYDIEYIHYERGVCYKNCEKTNIHNKLTNSNIISIEFPNFNNLKQLKIKKDNNKNILAIIILKMNEAKNMLENTSDIDECIKLVRLIKEYIDVQISLNNLI